MTVFNHFEGKGSLVLHTRGGKLFKVTQPGDWIKDRVRFFYDGLRRQRLVHPTRSGNLWEWTPAVTYLLSLLSRGWLPRVDPGGIHFFWFLRGSSFFVDTRLPGLALAMDCNYRGVYLGGFGLQAVEQTFLGLPTWTTYEEETILVPPTGGVSCFVWGTLLAQLFIPCSSLFGWSTLVTPSDRTSRVEQRALFQVSPLQRLLTVW